MAQEEGEAGPLELQAWKTWISAISAFLLALAFVVAGVWKISDPLAAAARMEQAQVPRAWSLAAALGFGVLETFAVMLLLALVAGGWARPSHGPRNAFLVLGAVCVFAALSYGITAVRQSLVRASDLITVNGKPFPLHQGRVFLFFFNPESLNCDDAARKLAKLEWGQTAVVAVPTQGFQFGQEFLDSTHLRGVLTPDFAILRKTFSFGAVPLGVALGNGHQRAAFASFGTPAPADTLRNLGFVR
jgi:hypothetical protein